jgi:hypothetical protein
VHGTLVRRSFIAGIAGGASALLSRRAFAQSFDTAAAGNGGSAGASADGGTVVVGGGSDVGCIGANGGIATADASGGDGNVAVIGSGDVVIFPDDFDFNGYCIPGEYAQDRRGNLIAFCTRSGRWIR